MDQSQTLNDAIGPAKPISTEMPHNEDPMNHAEAIFISLLHTGTFHAIAEVTSERVWLKSNARLNIQEMWRLGVQIDLEIILDRMTIPLHSIVLAVHSKLCSHMIAQAQINMDTSRERIRLYLPEFSPQIVSRAIHFLYTGDLVYTESDLPELRRIADNLQLGYLQYQLDLLERSNLPGGQSIGNRIIPGTAKEVAANNSNRSLKDTSNCGDKANDSDLHLQSSRIIRSASVLSHNDQSDIPHENISLFRTVFDDTFDDTQTRIIIDGFHEIEVEAGDLETPIQSPDPRDDPLDTAPGISDKDKPQPEQDISISELFNTKELKTLNQEDITPAEPTNFSTSKSMFFSSPINVDASQNVFPTTQQTTSSETTENIFTTATATTTEADNQNEGSPTAKEIQAEAVNTSTNKCDICMKTFTRANQLKIHKRIHTGERPYPCTTCDKKFTDNSALSKHLKIHQDEYGFKCLTCSKKFKLPNNLRHHMLTHTNPKENKCNICSKGFTFKRNLKRHMEIHEQKSSPSKKDKWSLCFLCNEPFNTPEELSEHLKKAHPEMAPMETLKYIYKLRCGECDKVFPSEETLTNHRQMVHQNNLANVQPPNGQTETVGGTSNQMICNCGITFANLRTLRRHQKLHHTGVGPYKCNFCNQRFKTNEALWKHMLEHTDRRRKHTCGYCSKSWERASDLAKHIRIHTGEKPHECKECNQRFNDLSSLRRHEGKHKPFVLYPCNHCNKSFKVPHNLHKHKEKHGDTSFGCNFCGESFTSQTSLNHHISQHNGSLTPFQCQTCDKQFKHSYDLTTHMRIHTSKKLYSCDVCGKQMADLSSFRKHERTHDKSK